MSSSSTQRLVDYFVLAGLDLDAGLEFDSTANGDGSASVASGPVGNQSPLKMMYKASLLFHFPKQVDEVPFDAEAVLMFALPGGVTVSVDHQPEPKCHTFLLTREDGSRSYGVSLVFYELSADVRLLQSLDVLQKMHEAECQGSAMMSKLDLKHMYVSKAACVLMPEPFVSTTQAYLEQLVSATLDGLESLLPVESYIYNLTCEVPLPPLGRSMTCRGLKSVLAFENPSELEFPLLEYRMEELLEMISIDTLLDVYTCVLLEKQVIFISTDVSKLMPAAECLTALLFPFSWQHAYVPILPRTMVHFLDAPLPYIMGLHFHEPDLKESFLQSLECPRCVLDLDAGLLLVDHDVPEFPAQAQLSESLRQLAELYSIKVARKPEERWGCSTVPMSRESLHSSLSVHELLRMDTSPVGGQLDSMDVSERTCIVIPGSTPGHLRSLSLPHFENRTAGQGRPKKAGQTRTAVVGNDPNKRLKALHELVQRVGIPVPPAVKELSPIICRQSAILSLSQQRRVEINSAIRDMFLRHIAALLVHYEKYVIFPKQTKEQWLQEREDILNFDRTAFLSDQSSTVKPFLSVFVDTQMLATFLDSKILATWDPPDSNVVLLDTAISRQLLRIERPDQSPVNNESELMSTIQALMEMPLARTSAVDYQSPKARALEGVSRQDRVESQGCFPIPSSRMYSLSLQSPKHKVRWDRRDREKRLAEHIVLNAALKEGSEGQKLCSKLYNRVQKYMAERRARNNALGDLMRSLPHSALFSVADKQIRACRTKTKALIALRMQNDGIYLGRLGLHAAVTESSLTASLCDIIEQAWLHGVRPDCPLMLRKDSMTQIPTTSARHTQYRSVLWCRLSIYLEEGLHLLGDLATDLPRLLVKLRNRVPPSYQNGVENYTRISLLKEIIIAKSMTDIKTDTGFARAWVRLAMERRTLGPHMFELLQDKNLIMQIYSPDALLCSDDHVEQFLSYLLMLKSVPLHSFTLGFPSFVNTYHVTLRSRKRLLPRLFPLRRWMLLAGSMGCTAKISFPERESEATFAHTNLGVLSSIRIGMAPESRLPSYYIDVVTVEELSTNREYQFPCRQSLSKTGEDASLERILFVVLPDDNLKCPHAGYLPPGSPPLVRGGPTGNTGSSETVPVGERMALALNELKKFCNRADSAQFSATPVACAPGLGLISLLVRWLSGDVRRLLGAPGTAWDAIRASLESLHITHQIDAADRRLADFHQAAMRLHTLGWYERCLVFLCVLLESKLLLRWIARYAVQTVSPNMVPSDPDLSYVCSILKEAEDVDVVFDRTIWHGLSPSGPRRS